LQLRQGKGQQRQQQRCLGVPQKKASCLRLRQKHADKTLLMHASCAFRHDVAFRKHKQLQKHLQQQALRQFAFA